MGDKKSPAVQLEMKLPFAQVGRSRSVRGDMLSLGHDFSPTVVMSSRWMNITRLHLQAGVQVVHIRGRPSVKEEPGLLGETAAVEISAVGER